MSTSSYLPAKWHRFRVAGLGLIVILFAGAGCAYLAATDDVDTGNQASPLDVTFRIEDQEVTLVNGFAEIAAAPGAASRITTRVWGKPELTDLNGDGQPDVVLILIQSGGGSGTFYYVAAALLEGNTYRGTNVVLLGDRIQPRGISILENRIIVEFLDRAIGEAFAIPPSVPLEQLVIYSPDSQQLTYVERDFEGEADPARMTLSMKKWYWLKTSYNDDTVHTPEQPEVFSITFEEGGKFLVTTDCNTMQGQYHVTDNKIQFEQMLSTHMYCEGSQEQLFARMLQNVSSWFFTTRGQLVLELRYDSGAMSFR